MRAPKKRRFKKKKRIKNRNNKQKYFYSGKKKRHTLKTQLVVDKKTQEVICTSFASGKKHDFKLFKKSKVAIQSEVQIIVDSGYQGLQKIHHNTLLPKKKSRKSPLTKEDKKNNTKIASQRVSNEHVIPCLIPNSTFALRRPSSLTYTCRHRSSLLVLLLYN